MVILSIFLLILAYLMGSICSAVIVSKTFSLPDPRTEGSSNPGATNVLRLSGKKYALLVLVTDILKGLIPVVIAKMFSTDPMFIGFVGLLAVIGHMYPIFFDFKGGKGVATAIGALLGFQFVVGMMVVGTWLVVARFSRYSSLASIVSIGLSPFYALLLIGRFDPVPPLFFMALLIIVKHKTNIGRLIDGTEPKIKLRKRSVLEEVMADESESETPDIIEDTATVAANETIPADVVPVGSKPKLVKTAKVEKSTEAPAEKKPAAKTKKPAAKKTTVKKNEPAKKTTKKPAAPKAKKEKTAKPKDKENKE